MFVRPIVGVGVEEADALPGLRPFDPARDALAHQRLPVVVERRERFERVQSLRRIDVGVVGRQVSSDFESSHR